LHSLSLLFYLIRVIFFSSTERALPGKETPPKTDERLLIAWIFVPELSIEQVVYKTLLVRKTLDFHKGFLACRYGKTTGLVNSVEVLDQKVGPLNLPDFIV